MSKVLRVEHLDRLETLRVTGVHPDNAASHISRAHKRIPNVSTVALRWFRLGRDMYTPLSVGGTVVPGTISVLDWESVIAECPTCKDPKEYHYARGNIIPVRWY